MRWVVESSAIGKSVEPERVCVEATGWQQALQEVRSRRGDAGTFASFSVELLDDGYRAIDPTTRTRYIITRGADDAPLTPAPANGPASKAAPTSAKPVDADAGRTPTQPAVWTLLVWDDLGARLTLTSDPPAPIAGDAIDAGATGLYGLQATGAGLDGLSVRHQGLVLDREVHFMRLTITWDGKEFKVERTHGSIAAGAGAETVQPRGE